MRIVVLIGVLVFLSACNKAEDRACIKSIGEQSTREIELGEFDKLHLGPHLRYVLVQDTVNKMIIHGGENLLNFVTQGIEENKLTITNDNDCSFLRSYDEIMLVELHLKKIINLHFEGTHELNCDNTINSDYLTLTIRDGAGEVSFNVNAIELRAIVTHGWGNFNFTGNVNYLNLDIKSNGFGDAYGLSVSDSLDVISKTAEDVHVNANGCQFRAQTISSGDIYFIGAPSSTQFNQYGAGALIDNN